MQKLVVTSPSFEDGERVPKAHTGHGEDISPELRLAELADGAVSLAVILDDMDHPIPAYNHWVIWNIPACKVIPGGIPAGKRVDLLGEAVQGIGYGKHRYRGPKPPFHWSHLYRFRIYALDCFLDLSTNARKRRLLTAMDGHILQQGEITCRWR